jgi:hypothetical protein
MATTRTSPAIRLFPSLGDVAFLAPALLLFGPMGGAKGLLRDGDTGWHLRTGEWILDHGRVPRHDLFSFTKPDAPWFAWEWLWDVTFGWLHRQGGMAAVIFASTLLLCVCSALLYRLVLRRTGNELLSIGVTGLAVAASAMHWLARPHLFTLLFVLVFYTLLERSREPGRAGRALWALPPLLMLWANLHGGFLSGILFILAYAAGDLVAGFVEAQPEMRRAAFARSRTYLAVAAASMAVTVVNPYGFRLHQHIYTYLTDSFLYEHIMEFFPFSFGRADALLYEGLFLLGAIAIYVCLSRKDFARAFLLLGWGHQALVMQRNVPIFALAAAPVVAVLAQEWLEGLKLWAAGRAPRAVASVSSAAGEFCAMERIGRWHAASAAGLACLGLALFSASPVPRFRAEYDPEKYPAAAVQFLERAGIAGGIFANDVWGGYLIYRRYPRMKVFVDGRSDFYGATFDEAYLDVLGVKHDWQQRLDRYHVDTVLLPVHEPLVGALKESRRWRAVYDDGHAIVFRSAAAEPAAPFSAVVADSGTICDPEIAHSVTTTTNQLTRTWRRQP